MRKCVVTVLGKDQVGIIAKVCTYLAENQINILDINQTIVQDFFNMMMIVDVSKMTKNFGQVSEEMEERWERDGLTSNCQREEIFEKNAQTLRKTGMKRHD